MARNSIKKDSFYGSSMTCSVCTSCFVDLERERERARNGITKCVHGGSYLGYVNVSYEKLNAKIC